MQISCTLLGEHVIATVAYLWEEFILLFKNGKLNGRNSTVLEQALTCTAHDFTRDFLVAAPGAKNLTTHATVVTTSKSGKAVTAIIALFTDRIWHPIQLEVSVFVGL